MPRRTSKRASKKTRYNFPPVEDLYYGQLDEKSQSRDWSEGYTETWDYTPASRCEACGQVVFGVTEGDYPEHGDVDPDSRCPGNVPGASAPMMNHLWPLEHYSGSAEDAAEKVVDLPVCIVTDADGDVQGFALTGGGMDLSWEIAEAYMRLGYLPPVTLRLPETADSFGERKKWIAAGMRRSIEGRRSQLDRELADLDRTVAQGEEYDRSLRRRWAARETTETHGRCADSRVCVEHAADKRVPSCKGRGKGRRQS